MGAEWEYTELTPTEVFQRLWKPITANRPGCSWKTNPRCRDFFFRHPP